MQKTILIIAIFFISLASHAQEKGKASFYNNSFHNRKTASGAIYHKDSLVAAHKKLPFGTLVKVKNLKNDKEVIVKIIDRGPYIRGRIIDLSRAAAKEIDMIPAGVVKVEVEVLPKDSVTKIEDIFD